MIEKMVKFIRWCANNEIFFLKTEHFCTTLNMDRKEVISTLNSHEVSPLVDSLGKARNHVWAICLDGPYTPRFTGCDGVDLDAIDADYSTESYNEDEPLHNMI